MSKPINWWTPVMGAREKELLCSVVDSNFPNDGEYTTEFERCIAEICGVPYAVAVTSGTAAIFLGLVACGIGPGNEVIVPDLTFIATANAVRLAGATPVLVDVDPQTLCLDPSAVEHAVTPRTKGIVPVHVSGRAAPLPRLRAIAQAYDLRVVEDAAEALGSRTSGCALGSLGDVGCFSFAANKTVTTGQGGVIVTKDGGLHQRLRALKDQGRPIRGTGGADEHPSLGYNFKLTNLQAAVGLAQLESFASRQEHLRRIFRLYHDNLQHHPRVTLPGFDIDGGEVPQWIDAVVDNRDGLHDYLLAHGIPTRKFWYPLHTQLPYQSDDNNFPVSTQLSGRALWLPSALTLTPEDVSFVCRTINDFYRHG